MNTEYKGFTIEVVQDEGAESPRNQDNLGLIVHWHRRYNLGDMRIPYNELPIPDSEIALKLPLYLYDHSGITISTLPFSCPWDSGQVGYIYATKERLREEYGCKRITKAVLAKAEAVLQAEVKIYDQYLRGDVYGYSIKDAQDEEIESCWDFYGEDYCLSEAKSVIDHIGVQAA